MPLTTNDRRQLYYYMRLCRAMEDAAWALASQGRIVGRLFTSHGQEAIAVGATYALEPEDVIAPLYRDLGALLVRGVTPAEVFAQYFAKRGSCTGGRDAGLHLGDMERGILGMISVLPDSVAVAVGIGLAFKIRRQERVVMAFFGDGAASTGGFHEAVNTAAVLGVPLVLVCENNGWALSTPTSRQFAAPAVVDRAPGYGIPGVQVDGNDVEAVHDAAAEAVARARSGGGPTLIECLTMRLKGHSVIDPADYVPPELLAEWSARDPLPRYRERLETEALWDQEREAALKSELETAVEAAIRQAEAMADPEPGDLYGDVYAE